MNIWELRQTVKRQQEQLDAMEKRIQALEKQVQSQNQTPPASSPIPADIFITPQSLKRAKKELWKALN